MTENEYKAIIKTLEQEIAKLRDIEIKRDRTASFYARTAFRILAWGVLVVFVIFRISLPLIERIPLYLDKNDGWVILISSGVLISVEGVKKAYEFWIMKKAKTI